MKTVAVCMNIPEIDNGGFLDPKVCRKYPGAGWISDLVNLGREQGILVTSGHQALYAVGNGSWQAKDILVIQEEKNSNGEELRALGSKGQILLCLESPLFTPRFYDSVPMLKEEFKHQILFYDGSENVRFPNFDESDLKEPTDWSSRRFMCMVVSNKHYKALPPQDDSPSFQYALGTQLHDLRYRALGHFYHRPGFELYGKGWGQLADPVDDKLETIRKYKFSLCFENGRIRDYVTEKVIDCLVAGVIPVYCGAPNIWDYVPDSCIINVAPDISFEGLETYLRDLPKERAERMIADGQTWIRSEEGLRHSHRGFAKRILGLL